MDGSTGIQDAAYELPMLLRPRCGWHRERRAVAAVPTPGVDRLGPAGGADDVAGFMNTTVTRRCSLCRRNGWPPAPRSRPQTHAPRGTSTWTRVLSACPSASRTPCCPPGRGSSPPPLARCSPHSTTKAVEQQTLRSSGAQELRSSGAEKFSAGVTYRLSFRRCSGPRDRRQHCSREIARG